MGPFLTRPKPLFQSEAKCKAVNKKLIFYSHAKKTHFLKKGFTLVLKVSAFGTWKWPIVLGPNRSSSSPLYFLLICF